MSKLSRFVLSRMFGPHDAALMLRLQELLAGRDASDWRDWLGRMMGGSGPLKIEAPWRVPLGRYRTATELELALRSLAEVDHRIDSLVIANIPLRTEPALCSVVAVEPRKFGMSGYHYLADIVDRASRYGLLECPAEVAPMLTIAYRHPVPLPFAVVAHQGVPNKHGDKLTFTVGSDQGTGRRRLWTRYDGNKWNDDEAILFSEGLC